MNGGICGLWRLSGRSYRILSKRKSKPRSKDPAESRVAETITVAWMLSVMTALLCEIGALLAWIYSQGRPGSMAAILAGLLFFGAMVIGGMALLMLPIVLKVRRSPPPLAITVAAILIAMAPVLAAILVSLH